MSKKGFSQQDKARIMRSYAKKNGGKIPKGSWPTKIQSIIDKTIANKS